MAYTVGKAAQNVLEMQRRGLTPQKPEEAKSTGYFVGKAAQNASLAPEAIPTEIRPEKPRGAFRKVAEFIAPTTTKLLTKDIQAGEHVTGRELLGAGLELGSLALPFGAVTKGAGLAAKALGFAPKAAQALKTAVPVIQKARPSVFGRALQTGAEAAGAAALYGAAQPIAEGKPIGEVRKEALLTGIGAGAFGATLPFAGAGLGKAYKFFKTPKVERLQNLINKESDELLSKTKGIIGKKQILVEGRNVPVDEYIKDPHVFKGLKVENARINPDDAIQTVRNRVDVLMSSKGALLPELDRFTPKISKEIIRQKAVATLKGTPADVADDVLKINKQLEALPDELSVSEIDRFRAQVRQSARDAKGISKTNEYAALEKASRDTVFDVTDNLPFDTNKEYQTINNEIKNLLGVEEFLDKTIRGQIVKGGRMTNVVGRVVGAVAGAKGGPLGTFMGSELGSTIANIITNNQLGSRFKLRLLRNLTDDPAVLKEAERFLSKAKGYAPPQLPAPTSEFRQTVFGRRAIPLSQKSPSAREAEEIARIQAQIQAQRSQGIGISPAARSATKTITKIHNVTIKPSVQQAPVKGKSQFTSPKDAGGAPKTLPSVVKREDIKSAYQFGSTTKGLVGRDVDIALFIDEKHPAFKKFSGRKAVFNKKVGKNEYHIFKDNDEGHDLFQAMLEMKDQKYGTGKGIAQKLTFGKGKEAFGAVAGIETDEEGKPTFSPEKAVLGIAGVAAFTKGRGAFKGLKNLSTKLLEKFRGMPEEITQQQFNEILNKATKEGVRQADKSLITSSLVKEGGKLTFQKLLQKLKNN